MSCWWHTITRVVIKVKRHDTKQNKTSEVCQDNLELFLNKFHKKVSLLFNGQQIYYVLSNILFVMSQSLVDYLHPASLFFFIEIAAVVTSIWSLAGDMNVCLKLRWTRSKCIHLSGFKHFHKEGCDCQIFLFLFNKYS